MSELLLSGGQKDSFPISVVVCTHNRADLLGDVLQTLVGLSLDKSSYEIIVVDNNSADRTRQLTKEYCDRFANIRYCYESQCGLSYARNRGWQEARGSYVAYLDDDCKVPTQWLTVAKEVIDQIRPAAFGGPYYAFYDSPKPYWWKDAYGAFEQSPDAQSLQHDEYLRGGNMFFRRETLEALGGFDSALGMSGNKLGYGEETELQRRIYAEMADELIYYDPRLYVFHLVRLNKMSLCWILSSHFASGRSLPHILQQRVCPVNVQLKLKLLTQAALVSLKFLADCCIGLLQRDRKRYPYLQNYLYENSAAKYMVPLGHIVERLCH